MPTYKVELRVTSEHEMEGEWLPSSKVITTNLLVETPAKVTALNWHADFFQLIHAALQIAQQARESVEIYSGYDLRRESQEETDD